MATYYVDGASGNDSNAGNSGSPWRTLRKPLTTAGVVNGDVIKVRTATYYEELNITKGIAYEADTGHTPTIDGRYSPALFGASGYKNKNGAQIGPEDLPYPSAANGTTGNWVLTTSQTAIVRLTAANSKIKGFVIRNVCGRGIGATGNNALAQDCRVDFTYGGSTYIEGGSNIRFDNVVMTRGSMKAYDPTRDRTGGPGAVQTSLIIKPCADAIVENCTVAFCYGEGISADKGTVRPVIRYNTCHTNAHWSMGMNEADSPSFYGNIIYWCDNLVAEMGKTQASTCFTCGNENAIVVDKDTGVVYEYPAKAILNNLRFYNNLLIGGDDTFIVASGGSQRPIAFFNGYIGYNTFVGMAITSKVFTWGTWSKQTHKDTVVENNIVLKHPNGGTLAKYEGGGTVTWRNNLGNATMPSQMAATITGLTANTLVNPFVSITGTYNHKSTSLPDVTTSFNPANYDLSQSSGAIGRASNRSSPYSWAIPAVNIDRYKAGRDDYNAGAGRYYDIGADEYDAGAPPVDPKSITASFNRTPASGNAPLTVNYTDTSQVAGGAAITGWLWNFGDGTTSTSQNPTKVYSAAGTYTTTLTITDSVNSLTSSFTGGTVTVTAVEAGTVSARFTRSPAAGQAGTTTFTFTDTSTVTGNGVINAWEWDFRDGTSSTLQNPTKVYATVGTYAPRLTVRDTVRGYSSVWTGPETVVSAAPPADAIEAGFSQSATSGQAPLTVNFTDTSLVAGSAVINAWEWDFGDGQSSTSASPSHSYAAQGTYTPRLTVRDTVRGLVDTFTGGTITVTAPPPPDAGGDVRIRQVRSALNTSNGNQTFTQSALAGITPKSARFIVTLATADGTAVDGEGLGIGATAGGAEWAAAVAAQHGVADTNAARKWVDDACLLLVDGSGNELVRASFVEWTTNGVTVNVQWTGTPAAYLVQVVFGGGTEYEAWVGTASLGASGSLTNVSCGFAADLVRGVATWGSKNEANNDATLSLGLAHRLGGQYVLERYYRDGLVDGDNRMRLFDGYMFHCRYNSGSRADARVTGWSSTGFTLTVSTDYINSNGLVMAERFGDVGSRVALVDSAITTGNKDYALDWNPQLVEHLLGQSTAVGSVNDNAKAGTIGLHVATADGEYSAEISGENGSATTNEQSLSDNQLIVVGHTGTTLAAGATTLGTSKYTVNYATAPGTAMKWPALAVQQGQATGGGGDYVTAEFQADVTAGNTPLRVLFTDLSSSTNPITSWLWDFGDGETSTLRDPSHVYRADGPFTVSLTVSDGTLSDTETKGDLIQATTIRMEEFLVGPFLMRPISENSSIVTHKDPEDTENAGYMQGALLLGAIRIGADPEEPAVGVSDVPIWYDPDTDAVYLKRPDGTIKTIA